MIDNRVTGRTVSPRAGNTILLRRTGAMLLLSGLVTACASPQGGRGPAVGPAPAASAAPAVQPAQAAAKKVLSLEPDPADPYGGFIREASRRFDMPEPWIRAVIQQESQGRPTAVSSRGAVGLMQVTRPVYAEMRVKYGLGRSMTNPRDNILAGTAFLREMYELFGAPGFLGAYNCGPACYAAVMARRQRLPGETRSYLAALSPLLQAAKPRIAVQAPAPAKVTVLLADYVRRSRTQPWRNPETESLPLVAEAADLVPAAEPVINNPASSATPPRRVIYRLVTIDGPQS